MDNSDFIKVYDGVFSPELCESLIGHFSLHPETVVQGRGAGGVYSGKKCFEIPMMDVDSRFPDIRSDHQTSVQLFRDCLNRYISENVFIREVVGYDIKSSGLKIKHYQQGVGVHDIHVDNGPEIPDRVISAVAYLNTVEEGGGTYFPVQDRMVEAVQGRVAVFPPFWTFPHQSIIPKSGDKYSMSSFFFTGGRRGWS